MKLYHPLYIPLLAGNLVFCLSLLVRPQPPCLLNGPFSLIILGVLKKKAKKQSTANKVL